ncbi:MAG TPA: TetR/AcrR family transcriptional regulator [Acidimicrobiales bacterium]|nr:TetR/AcrR family transcriptional regulator [Acidimicrobiales bacterium]
MPGATAPADDAAPASPRPTSAPTANTSDTGSRTRTVRRAMSAQDKEERRNDILAAAKNVFARRGYHATTIADIAKAAELSYGSIYWYFDSKDALFHALIDSEGQALRDHVTHALTHTPAHGSPVAPFRAAVLTTFEFFESDRALVKLLFRDAHALGDRFEKHLFDIYEGFVGDVEAIVEDAQRRGLIVDAPARMVAFSVGALVGQVANRRLVTDDGLPAAVAADFVVSLLLDGLLPR